LLHTRIGDYLNTLDMIHEEDYYYTVDNNHDVDATIHATNVTF